MPATRAGQKAVVIGAGMGGYCGARARRSFRAGRRARARQPARRPGGSRCVFNPLYGQGMRVAGQEAVLRRRLLAQSVGRRGPLATLASAFFTQVESVLETPWAMAAIPDFIFSETTGHRPPDLAREFALALTRLAARKPDVRRLMMGVSNLLEPRSVCRSPILMARVLVEMARDDRA